MDITIQPGKLSGVLQAIPSKSLVHRYLICAAFAATSTTLICPESNRDIQATVDCLQALGAEIQRTESGYSVSPIRHIPENATLNCCESGSTLRFLLPIVGALGVDATFQMEGRLPQRPLSPLWEEMERMGCSLSRPTENTLHCSGQLKAGQYSIDGCVSSQFITGLLYALPLIKGETQLTVTGKLESKPYVTMTEHALKLFQYPYSPSPEVIRVEGDWSNSAFFLAANSLGNSITVSNLNSDSPQGDCSVVHWLKELTHHCRISASDIPDLIPILSVVAAANQGAVFTDIQRLRLKESDRVEALLEMIRNLGGQADATESTLTVCGTGLVGGTVNSHNDHRIAMSAAIASTVCTSPVTITGADAVNKSYPHFWEEFRRLGGKL